MTDFNNMLKQAQEMQTKMMDAQKKIEEIEAEGSAGGGLVKVSVNGKNHVTNVTIDPSLLVADEVDILEDLILAAHNDAKDKVQQKSADEMSSITGGLKLPPGFKMPI
ncbi:YbaB/EbfC family nucleoid-associated protein [Pelagibacterales bacterium]|jgi:nucleoid-associated protein EbfC|nr:YbaB/EbfC family nucleoid-associated protein [Pelagibacterales bacterium]MDA7763747.1 YbaB/EbfC family nucleoid-associated protein [Pelagibacterales bacterium]MDA9373156.1 YbaB/EbfC family nucleoid-associated protein [Pelagibacterales bacterium]MDA9980691.1 YbaB/EbfC family nucleoid-associated protein [Pelagibacterales bacterium]MDB9817967.1 YbaB/EbfC family nucleoid-associated protein [Pelagibacterales bacterium]|tara:strand:- start:115 stop:438 length:324 start_codon:yes stop_codon:yes gene_type:complete